MIIDEEPYPGPEMPHIILNVDIKVNEDDPIDRDPKRWGEALLR